MYSSESVSARPTAKSALLYRVQRTLALWTSWATDFRDLPPAALVFCLIRKEKSQERVTDLFQEIGRSEFVLPNTSAVVVPVAETIVTETLASHSSEYEDD
jgi:hypothetical protein